MNNSRHIHGADLLGHTPLTAAELEAAIDARGIPRLCHCCGAAEVPAAAGRDALFCAACHASADAFNSQGGSPYLPTSRVSEQHPVYTRSRPTSMAAGMARTQGAAAATHYSLAALTRWRKGRVTALLLSVGLHGNHVFEPGAYLKRAALSEPERAAVFAVFAAWWRSGVGLARAAGAGAPKGGGS